MTTSVDVIGWKTTPSTEDIMTLFHLFHIDAIPPIPHLHPESGPYIYIYKAHFQGGDVEWVEWHLCGISGIRSLCLLWMGLFSNQ